MEGEYEYWKNLSITTNRGASIVLAPLGHLVKSYNDLSSAAVKDVPELLDNVDLQLSDLWKERASIKATFTEDRMRNIFRLFDERCVVVVRSSSEKENLWTVGSSVADEFLLDSVAVCDKWSDVCRTLTEELWIDDERNRWTSGSVKADNVSKLKSRLNQIRAIKETVDESVSLLGTTLEKPYPSDDFVKVDSFDVSQTGEEVWSSAVRSFDQKMSRYDEVTAERLKKKFYNPTADSRQMIFEFQKCHNLLKRPKVKNALAAEREMLLGHVGKLIARYEQDFDRDSFEIYDNHSPTVSNMIWTRQILLQLRELNTGLQESLGDVPKFEAFSSKLTALTEVTENRCRGRFDEWCADILRKMKQPKNEFSLDLSSPLLEIEQPSGRLSVNFSDQLVILIKEVRYLESIGFRMPEEIKERSEQGKKLYEAGIVLMQVAHFYNTIDQQMIHCQKPMMIESAKRFERIIRSGGKEGIKWTDTKKVASYIGQVHEATLALTQENRKLRNLHEKIVAMVQQMTETSLLQKTSEWKRLLNEIHKIVLTVAVETERYPAENVVPWRLDIDQQIRKALEVQMKKCLVQLSQNLPEMQVDLVYRNNAPQFRPSLDEIRQSFGAELTKLYEVPASLKPLSEVTAKRDLFRQVAANCQTEKDVAQKNVEELVKRLESVVQESQKYVAMSVVDVKFFEDPSSMKTAQDFDVELKALKQRGKGTEHLPLSIKVDNVVVNLSSLRNTIDGLLQDTYESLSNALRQSLLTEVQMVSAFVDDSNKILSTRPSTTEELHNLSLEFLRLVRESEEMRPRLASIEEKNALLKSVTGRGTDKSDSVLRSWNGVAAMLEDHKAVMKEQTAALEERVEKDLKSFEQELEKFEARWKQARPSEDLLENLSVAETKKVAESVQSRREDLQKLIDRKTQLEAQCKQLNLAPPNTRIIDAISLDFERTEQAWKDVTDFSQEVAELGKEDWLTFRNKLYRFEELLKTWSGKMQTAAPTAFTLRIQQDIARYRAALPVLKATRGDAFSDEHWGELFGRLGVKNTNVEQLTFGDLIGDCEKIIAEGNTIKELAARAQAEVSVREALRELEIWAAAASFHLTNYKDSAGSQIQIVRDWAELLTTVGEKQRLLQSTRDSQHYGKFADRIAIWEQRLVDLSFLLDNLHHIQRKWVYLEPICAHNTLPNEEGRFKPADADFRGVLKEIVQEPRLLSWLRPALKNLLPNILDQLVRCQKALNEFLETNRLAFPRFYFIGDDDLLEILGQASNPKVLQAHLKKLFAGVHSVEFGPDGKSIVSVRSPEGEVLQLRSPVSTSGSVEIWLGSLSQELKRSLMALLKDCLKVPFTVESLGKFPSQVLRLSERIKFTELVEKAIKAKGLDSVRSDVQKRLDSLTSIQHSTVDLVRLTTIQGLILDNIHRLDVVSRLIQDNITKTDEWLWQKQLRYYAQVDGAVKVRTMDAEFQYSFEYHGCLTGLVHTALTDKCFLTLTQAMLMGLGGNPYGPAGTGKTESVKELGAHLGRQVLVFNCDEGIDPTSMGRIFIGLLKCGAWGCFDEFNRLDELTMSAISTQIMAIQAALKDSSKQLELLDRKVDINRQAGIFVTLNPASKGYGGRQKLPDNLKQLFRPMAMSVPDAERIAQVMFLAEGFHHAAVMGKKLVVVYSSAKQLLSQQQHYDWGLRAIKSTIQMAGRLLASQRESSTKSGPDGQSSQGEEASTVVQAVKSNMLSKLVTGEQKRFLALMYDGFPSANQEVSVDVKLEDAVKSSFGTLGLIENTTQVRKAVELRHQLAQRIGVVAVGPATSGKTSVWKLLHSALNSLNQPLIFRVINPTAMPKHQLLGSVDETTREWTDGVLTKCVREVLAQADQTAAWIVLDGDIDPNWIESLNSVLDDNRLLTLPSGERLRFPPNVNLLFETDNLKAASPATVSRMGMVFFSVQDVSVKWVAEAWVLRQLPETRLSLKDHINDILVPAVSRVASLRSTQNTAMSEVSVLQTALRQLANATNRNDFTARVIQTLSPLCGTTGNVTKFATEVLGKSGYDAPDPRQPSNLVYDPEGETLKSIRIDDERQNTVEGVFGIPSQELAARRIAAWLKNGASILVSGPVGCGKSTVLKLAFEYGEIRRSIMVQCTSATSPSVISGKIKRACLAIPTAQGKILRPKNVDKLVVVVKDVHVVQRDKWGHSQVQSFVRQVVDQGGFFDGGDWVQLEGVQMVVTISGGKDDVLSSRLIAAVCYTSISFPNTEELQSIATSHFTNVISTQCKGHTIWSRSANVEKFAKMSVQLFLTIRERFASSSHSYYVFTLKDLTSLITAFHRYTLTDQSGSLLLTSFSNEAVRLFQDKLKSSADRSLFDGSLSSALKEAFPSVSVDRDAMFGSNATGVIDGAPLPVLGRALVKTSMEELKLNIQNAVRVINREDCVMEVYVHDALVVDVVKVAHWLGQPGGSLLMAAPSGYGRRTVAVIAAKLQQGVLMKLKIGKGYGAKQFQTDLKRVLELVVVRNEDVVLLLEDVQIVDPEFLEMVTSLLSGGEYVGLYSDEETEKIHGLLVDQMARENFNKSSAEFFVYRVKRNFHCVVTMDNTGNRLTSLFDRIPSLTSTFHILSNDNLPENILRSIPEGLVVAGSPTMDGTKSINTPSEPLSVQLAQSMLFIHSSSPPNMQSSAKFYQFIRTFQSVSANLTSKASRDSQRLQAGLDQLTKARNDVMVLRRTVGDQHTALVSKQEEAKRAMEEIREGMSGANTQKEEVTMLKADLEKEREKLLVREKDIAQELQDVLPMLEGAKAAVNKIKTSDLSEIKSLRAPPTVIHNILEGVLKIFGNKDTSWSAMRAFLTPTVKDEIIRFDAEKVTRENLRQTQAVLEKFKMSFEEETAKRGSVAAAPLAAWVKACVKYAEVYDKIAPLAAEKRKLESTIDSHAKRVTNASLHIGKLSDRIDILQASFQQLTEEAAVMKIELNRLSERLKVAQVLVEKLEGEYNRWSTQLKESSLSERQLQTNALLAAGFVTYLAACSEDERKTIIARWAERLKVEAFDLTTLMTTESTRLAWRVDGLSSDTLSTENAVTLQNTQVPPLMIDPAAAIADWIRKFLKCKTVEVADQEDMNFQSLLELSVRFGKTLIVEVSDGIDPVLVPLLRRDMVKQGSRLQVEIGDKLLDFHPQFRLFLTTRNSSLAIHPQTASLLNIVSFTPTRAALANQLLSIVIECKLPEVERQRKELLKEQEDLKIKLTALEDSLLNELANSQGNILENVELQESLNKTKSSSMVIEKNLEDSRRVKETLDKDQAVFAILANKCCAVYFALRDLHKLNPLYRFGLPMFVKLYQKAVENLAKDDHVKDQLQKFCAVAFYQVIHYVYAHVSRSIFKRDRLTSLLQFVKVVRPELLSEPEWNFFMTSKTATTKSSTTSFSCLDADQQARFASLLESVPDLRPTLQLSDESAWTVFVRHPQCETAFPTTLKLTQFQQVLVVNVLRPDRMISALSVFLTKSLKLGDLSVDTSLKGLLEDSHAETPILIVTAGGADPSVELRDLAMERAPGKSVQMLAMGQRDVESAVAAIRYAADSGSWLCLENLHLVPSFFQRVSKEVRSIQPKSTFRLWMTTENATSIPVQLLESTLKCVYEAPPGVKQNLQLTLKESSETIRQTIGSSPSGQRLVLLLFWLHAVLQERRNFAPRGWTKFYEFNISDLRSAMGVIAKFTKSSSSSETHIRGLLTEVVYGGRVDLNVDLRVLVSYVYAFMRENVDGKLFGSGGVPPLSSLPTFVEFVKQMPEREAPAVLGLPANIEGALQKSESERVMTDLKGLQKASIEATNAVRGNTDRLVEVASALLKKWESYAVEDSSQRQSSNLLVDFFQQELIFGATFVKTAHAEVTTAVNPREKATLAESNVSDTSRALKFGETPAKWLSVWEGGPADPVMFLKAIGDKLAFCLSMVSQAQANALGMRIDMGRLFHPQAVIGTLRHLAARLSVQPLEQLILRNEWSLNDLNGIPYTVVLMGFRLEGALFNGTTLHECLYDSPSSVSAPVCYVAWVPQSAGHGISVNGKLVDVPVFCTTSREELAFYLSVPCASDSERWTRTGLAFILEG